MTTYNFKNLRLEVEEKGSYTQLSLYDGKNLKKAQVFDDMEIHDCIIEFFLDNKKESFEQWYRIEKAIHDVLKEKFMSKKNAQKKYFDEIWNVRYDDLEYYALNKV